MTARRLAVDVRDQLRKLPWHRYLCAVTAMAGAAYEIYEPLLGEEALALCSRSLYAAELTVRGESVPSRTVHELASSWTDFQNYDTPDHNDPGLSALLSLFDALILELVDESARYYSIQWVTQTAMYLPARHAPEDSSLSWLVRLDLDTDHLIDSPQGQLLRRYQQIVEQVQKRDTEQCAPETLRTLPY